MPLETQAFLAAARAHLEPLRGRFIHEAIERDYLAKTGQSDTGYEDWLRRIVPWLGARAGAAASPRILDLGCGTGELAVLMNHLGFDAAGSMCTTITWRWRASWRPRTAWPPIASSTTTVESCPSRMVPSTW